MFSLRRQRSIDWKMEVMFLFTSALDLMKLITTMSGRSIYSIAHWDESPPEFNLVDFFDIPGAFVSV